MSERMNLQVEDGIGDVLTALAGGERKRGAWLSDLLRAMELSAGQQVGAEFETLRLSHQGLAGQVRTLDGRVMGLEAQVAAMIADRSK